MPAGAWLAVVVMALALAACGGGDGGDSAGAADDDPVPSGAPGTEVTMADLDGTTFVSTDVTGHALVPGSRVTLSVEGEALSVSGGCNTMFGAAAVSDRVLRWTGEPAATMMACPDDLAAQDQWLLGLFGGGMTAGLDGEELVLSEGPTTIRLAQQPSDPVAGGLEALLGQRWLVVETIAAGIVERVPTSVRQPELDVAADGTVLLFPGCNTGRTSVEVDGDALVFSPAMTTKKACDQAATTVEQRVLTVLEGRVDVTVEGQLAVLTRGTAGLVVEVG